MVLNNRQRRLAQMMENKDRKTLTRKSKMTFMNMKTNTRGTIMIIKTKEDTRMMRNKITLESLARKG
eukprot:6524550-Heterocapsa_arctica.AAC.1